MHYKISFIGGLGRLSSLTNSSLWGLEIFPPGFGTHNFPYFGKFQFHLTDDFQEETCSSYSSLPPLDYLNLTDFMV